MVPKAPKAIFAACWPHQEGGEIATLFNSVPKYVASRGRPDLSWAGSTQLGPDLAGAVREIRDRHEHVAVVGSLDLVQTLLREKLFDRLGRPLGAGNLVDRDLGRQPRWR